MISTWIRRATVIFMAFWQSVESSMRASQPLLRALRIADGDETPAMAQMWAAMDVAKTHIKDALAHKPNLLGQVVAIVDKRWDNQMEQKLHGAALFLNPNKFFAIKESNKRQASRLRSMFNDVLWKMVPDDTLQTTIRREADDYELTEVLWWNSYGGLAFDLQTLAKRIISLCYSASGCERNWSVFAHIHTKGRNRLEYKRLNKLSYVSYNRKMEARFQNLREQGSKSTKSNPLILEEFQWDNEWVDINAEMVHEDQAQVMDGETPLLWSQVDEAMGASTSLAGRNYPRRARGDPGEPIARPIGPYITYTRNHARTRLVVHDEELRAELEAVEYDQGMESNDEDDGHSPNDEDTDFQIDDMDLEA